MNVTRIPAVMLLLLLLLLASTPVLAADVQLLTGKSVKGTIAAVDAQSLTLKEEGGGAATKLNVKELASVELGGKQLDLKAATYDEIELTDGSILRVAPRSLIKGKKVVVATLPGAKDAKDAKDAAAPTIDLPLTSMYYLLRNGHDAAVQTGWKTTLSKRETRDSLILFTGGAQQRLLGTVNEGNADGDRISFEDIDGKKLDFALARVNVGIIFNQPRREVIPPTICKVVDTFGNLLVATAIDFEGSGMKVTTVSGAVVSYSNLNAVARLDFTQSNVTYLTALTPAVAAPEDHTELFLTYTVDKTRQAKPLQLGGKVYPKGLCIFAGTTLTYNLGGDYREFKAIVGVDDSIEVANCKVKLSIVADGRTLFSQVLGRKDKPRELVLDVKDVKQLKIVVEQEELFYANCVNLCEVRVQK